MFSLKSIQMVEVSVHWFAGVLQSLCIQMEKQPIEEISDGVATLFRHRLWEGLLEALPRLARDAVVGVIVPAWWGRE
jgi:hypothetical protein